MSLKNSDYRLPPEPDRLKYAIELLSTEGGALVHQLEFNAFCADNRIAMLILFGSMATCGTHQDSDIDLAWLPRRGENSDPLSIDRQLSVFFRTQHLDVVDMRMAPPLLQWNIACHGVPLHLDEESDWFQYQRFAIKQWDDVRRINYIWASSVERFLTERSDE